MSQLKTKIAKLNVGVHVSSLMMLVLASLLRVSYVVCMCVIIRFSLPRLAQVVHQVVKARLLAKFR